ncbi:MAG: KH domain-containing protein [Candidatus Saccharimonadales bacterium]
MIEIDQQFVEYVVKSLVGKPDAVHIDRRIDEKGVLLELTVDPEDLGRVIGKRGATAQSLRTLLRALGTKNDARYNLKIVDNGAPREDRVQPSAGSDAPKDDAVSDDTKSDDSLSEGKQDEKPEEAAEIVEAPKEAEPEPIPEEKTDEAIHEEQTSDRLQRAREELADLDDLDV